MPNTMLSTTSDDSVKGGKGSCCCGTCGAKQKKVRKVMHEFKQGDLHSSSGEPVKKRSQALAIAMSEARRGKKKA